MFKGNNIQIIKSSDNGQQRVQCTVYKLDSIVLLAWKLIINSFGLQKIYTKEKCGREYCLERPLMYG